MNDSTATELAAEVTRTLHVKVAMKDGTSITSLAKVMHIDRNTVKNRLKSGNVSLQTFFVIAAETGCDPIILIAEAMEAVSKRAIEATPSDGHPKANRHQPSSRARKGNHHGPHLSR
jgi:plasmid maintenance system antidote protein VapI